MKKLNRFIHKGSSVIVLFGIYFPLYAQTSWQCTATDVENIVWTSAASYERMALNQSLDACKKASKAPQTCHVSERDCESFYNGVATRPLWQCTAIDKSAIAWKSDTYRHADDAAIAAKSFCEDRSALPETCFTNLLFCKNLNPLD